MAQCRLEESGVCRCLNECAAAPKKPAQQAASLNWRPSGLLIVFLALASHCQLPMQQQQQAHTCLPESLTGELVPSTRVLSQLSVYLYMAEMAMQR